LLDAAEYRAANPVQLTPEKKSDLKSILKEAETLTSHP